MKRIYLLLLLSNLIAAFMISSPVYAVPMIYTFEGTLPANIKDDAGIIADAGLEAGSPVSYIVLIDFDQPGSYTLNDGMVYTYPLIEDAGSTPIYYYYDDYLGGSALQEKNDGIHNAPSDVAEYNVLLSSNRADWEGWIRLNSDDNPLYIYANSSPEYRDWEVGDSFDLGYNAAFDSNGNESSVGTMQPFLTLTSITPVPEPATMLLLGSGLFGLAGFRRKFKK
jgi:hypothetical protein